MCQVGGASLQSLHVLLLMQRTVSPEKFAESLVENETLKEFVRFSPNNIKTTTEEINSLRGV